MAKTSGKIKTFGPVFRPLTIARPWSAKKGFASMDFFLRLMLLSSDPDEMELLVVPRVELLEEFREHLKGGG